ncbi:pro-resilin-like [Penaeus monodon]|uniref:pro-resilin-like n=1 Tax=Penaeus monodon TaxID=6687 RepID=UPI0018A77B24|nr:pro-resilin-like [Penaeus monodon]
MVKSVRLHLATHPAAVMKQITIILVVLAAAAAQGNPQGYNIQGPGGLGSQSASVPANYAFQWEVDDAASNNFFGQEEQREDVNTQGSYFVQLPDGRRLKVDYFVDDTGYHPSVSYEGEIRLSPGGGGGGGASQGFSKPASVPSQLYAQPGK